MNPKLANNKKQQAINSLNTLNVGRNSNTNIGNYNVIHTEPYQSNHSNQSNNIVLRNQNKINELDHILKTPTLNISSNIDLKGKIFK